MSWGSKALSSCYVSCLCRPCHPCCLQMLWCFLLFLLPLLIIVIDAAQWSHREATIQPHEPQKPRSQQQFSAWMWHCHATWVVWTLNLSFSRCANHLQQFPAEFCSNWWFFLQNLIVTFVEGACFELKRKFRGRCGSVGHWRLRAQRPF